VIGTGVAHERHTIGKLMNVNEIDLSTILLVCSVSVIVGIGMCTRANSVTNSPNCLNSILLATIASWQAFVVCSVLFPSLPAIVPISIGGLLDWEAVDVFRTFGIYLIMAKVLGPLYSMTASGKFKDNIVFKTSAKGTTAGAMPLKRKSTSPLQEVQQDKFRIAKDGWKTLSDDDKGVWAESAAIRGTTAYRLYVSEYFVQQCEPPNLPIAP